MNDNIQIGSPRAGGITPRTPIKAQALFADVQMGVSHERRTDGAQMWSTIDNLKDNRGFFEKWVMGPFIQDIAAENLSNKFIAVREEFAKYKDVGIEIPKEILNKFVSHGEALLASPAYIDSAEAEQLKNLAYEGEQRLKFNEQLKERPGLRFDGILGDGLSDNPSEENLTLYCDALKKTFEKKRCFPDAVTSDPDPRKFVFLVAKGEPQVIIVKTKADLGKLQLALAACNDYGELIRANSGKPELRRDTLIAAEPTGTQAGAEKRKIMVEFNNLEVDDRGFFSRLWDNMWGAVGSETAGVKNLKLNNQTRFEKVIRPGFNEFVAKNDLKNDDFDKAVLAKQPKAVQDKLKEGELLTSDEVKKLQADTHMAILRQRYLDELRDNPIPAKLELEEKFVNSKMPEKAIFEKYLHKLREELMRANYPTMITSDLNPHRFKFFIEGKYEEFSVHTLKDLRKLRERLDACVKEAKKEQEALGRYEPGAQARVRADKGAVELTAEKTKHEEQLAAAAKEKSELIAKMKAEYEEARTKVTKLQAAYSEERDRRVEAEKTVQKREVPLEEARPKLQELREKRKAAEAEKKMVQKREIGARLKERIEKQKVREAMKKSSDDKADFKQSTMDKRSVGSGNTTGSTVESPKETIAKIKVEIQNMEPANRLKVMFRELGNTGNQEVEKFLIGNIESLATNQSDKAIITLLIEEISTFLRHLETKPKAANSMFYDSVSATQQRLLRILQRIMETYTNYGHAKLNIDSLMILLLDIYPTANVNGKDFILKTLYCLHTYNPEIKDRTIALMSSIINDQEAGKNDAKMILEAIKLFDNSNRG